MLIRDMYYSFQLIQQVFDNKDKLKSFLDGRIPNWDTERIAQIDLAILIGSTIVIGAGLYTFWRERIVEKQI